MSNDASVSLQTTHHIRDHCLCLAAQRAARALSRRFDEALRPVGLTSGQFSLLISLNRPNAPSIGSVADLLAMDRTTLTANIKPLARRGLLRVTDDPADRRVRRLALTAEGEALLRDAVPIWERTHIAVDGVLPVDTLPTLRAGLRALGAVEA